MIDQPINLTPVYQQRVWGGRKLETAYGRNLPDPNTPFGESWEVVDREDEQSLVAGGIFKGKTLHELWTNHRVEVFGEISLTTDRFPILVKILDAREKLSIQVHPPTSVAGSLKGEPKTEMWYVAKADSEAALYVGLKEGVTRDSFEEALKGGKTENLVHKIKVSSGEFIFIPSGRLHAIGAGLVIYEIQQNSDTTYRVFDWNRVGLDGNPRQLHIEESIKCIDFDDIEPAMGTSTDTVLADCEYFRVEKLHVPTGENFQFGDEGEFSIVAVVNGSLKHSSGEEYKEGDFFLIPATLGQEFRIFEPVSATLLKTMLP